MKVKGSRSRSQQSARSKQAGGCLRLKGILEIIIIIIIIVIVFFFLDVTTITLERLNLSEPNFHT